MAEPSDEDVRRSRVAAVVMVVLGGLAMLAGGAAADERFAALGLVLGAPTLAVGALTFVYIRVRPSVYRHVEPHLRKRRSR